MSFHRRLLIAITFFAACALAPALVHAEDSDKTPPAAPSEPVCGRDLMTPEEAAAHEATASTGGQLMPPVMGIAAFVMAELLATPYSRIALAGVIPAVAYYFALYMIVHLKAKRRGIGTLQEHDLLNVKAIAPRAYLFLPPVILIAILASDYSAIMAALVASVAALVICYARAESRLGLRGWVDMIEEVAKQAAQVAVPIIAIGIIIAVAIQIQPTIGLTSACRPRLRPAGSRFMIER